MSRANWRVPGAYEALRSLDAPGFAWEYLRRNEDFLRERRKLQRDAKRGSLDLGEAERFTRRWGVRFRESGLPTRRRRTAWAPNALPSVVALTSMPAELFDPAFRLPRLPLRGGSVHDGEDYVADHSGATVRLHIDPAGVEPPAALLPLDLLFEQRANAALRVWRALLGRSPSPNPAALSKAREDRLVLALRALDGRLEGASHREIAEVLFDTAGISGRAWKTHDLRDRTFRLVRFGFDMMRGGYRSLLLHPYRRRS